MELNDDICTTLSKPCRNVFIWILNSHGLSLSVFSILLMNKLVVTTFFIIISCVVYHDSFIKFVLKMIQNMCIYGRSVHETGITYFYAMFFSDKEMVVKRGHI